MKSAKKAHIDPAVFNVVNPIVSITAYKNGCITVNRENRLQYKIPYSPRETISGFSNKSRQRLALIAKETRVEMITFITLTYGVNFPHSGLEVKRQLKIFLRTMTKYFGGFDYLWFFEFQKRGAPHIHMATNLDIPTDEDRSLMSKVWVDASQDLYNWLYSSLRTKRLLQVREASYRFHCREEQWEPIRAKEGLARYALKYALKTEQKTPPAWFRDVGRFWGTSRRTRDLRGTTVPMTEDNLRLLLAKHRDGLAEWDILPTIIFDVFT